MTTATDIGTSCRGRLAAENGQALVEYALILTLVSIVGLVLSPIGQWVVSALTKTATDI